MPNSATPSPSLPTSSTRRATRRSCECKHHFYATLAQVKRSGRLDIPVCEDPIMGSPARPPVISTDLRWGTDDRKPGERLAGECEAWGELALRRARRSPLRSPLDEPHESPVNPDRSRLRYCCSPGTCELSRYAPVPRSCRCRENSRRRPRQLRWRHCRQCSCRDHP